jgi:hypothetical protein
MRWGHLLRPHVNLFRIGLLLYFLSFLLVAVAGPRVHSGPAFGYYCAFYSLFIPLVQAKAWVEGNATVFGTMEVLSMAVSGMINLVFLTVVFLVLFKRAQLTTGVANFLRFLVLAMIPFCWIVFHFEALYPREGHFLWIVGMLLVLFSDQSMKRKEASSIGRS